MTDLSAKDLEDLSDKINDEIDNYSLKTLRDKPRTHLGISEIGSPCARQLYYKFHWCGFQTYKTEHDEARMLRLFKRGHREEERFINYLKGIEFQVSRFDENGKQFRVSGIMGHYGGSCDGIAITPWLPDKFLLEFKTHNSKSFLNYLDKGLHKAKPQHFAQMSGYGYHMNIEYGIYFPENKNDDDIRVRVIKLDHKLGRELEQKASDIITAVEPPTKISENPAYMECKWCDFLNICHYGAAPIKNCRSCRSAMPTNDATWTCTRYNQVIPSEFIKCGCNDWLPI